MFRFFLRSLGLWLLAAAFIFLVYDGTKWIASNAVFVTRVTDVWSNIHQSSLSTLQPTLEHFAGWLWSPLMTTFLSLPVELLFEIVGAVFLLLGRKRKPLIGYSRN